jgi:glycosyltransferase involved in cell wall biosynthesis
MERMVVDLALCQLSEGHQPFIYCLTHKGRLGEVAAAAGIQVRAFAKPVGPNLRTVLQMARQLRADHPDVLHTHNHLAHHYGVAAAILARVRHIVNTRHGVERRIIEQPGFVAISNDPKDKTADLIFRATLPWVDKVVMVSEATRQFFVTYRGIPAGKTAVVYNGAHLEPFLGRPAKPGSAHPRIRFGIAARLVREKDPYTLLRAFSIVIREVPAAELHIAGDGPLRREMESLAESLQIAHAVHFLGNLSDTSEFLSQLDIYVLSSITEGMPVSVIEAMAASLPVVATRAGGIAEAAIEGQNAAFAEPGDVNGLARAMVNMACATRLEDMGAFGRRRVQEEFTIEKSWHAYYKLFASLSGGSESLRS